MKIKLILSALFIVTIIQSATSQKSYLTTGGDIIFSFSNASRINSAGTEYSIDNDPRFTVWFHISAYYHFDFSKNIGLYTGLHMRNLGLITNEPSSTDSTIFVKWKRRSYTLGLPLGIKLGALDKDFYFFFGAEYDYNYHYKEKEFLETGKRKITAWNGNQVTRFIPSVFGGVCFPGGMTLQLVWQLDNFINQDFEDNSSGSIVKPNEGMNNSRIFYISLGSRMRWKSIEKAVTTPTRIAVL